MDTRLIVIISSLAVLSSATTSTDTITSTVPGNGGSTDTITSTVPGNGGGSVTAISSISQTTLNPSSLPSKSSSVLEENTTQDPSGTTEPPVNDPHTTIEPSTKIQCNCSEYVTPSPVTTKPQTSMKSTNITMSPSPTTNATSPSAKATTSISKASSQTTQAPSQTTQAPSQTTQAPPTTTQAPSQTTQAPTTQTPSQTTQAPSQTTQAPSQTTQAPPTTTQAPSQTTQAPPTTTQAPSQTTQAPPTTTQAPSQTTQAPPTTTQAPSQTTQVPPTTTKAPTTQAPSPTTQASSTTTQAPSQTTKAPTTQAPSQTTQAPTTTTQAPSQTTQAPATTTKTPTNQVRSQTTTAPTTASASTNKRRRRGVVYLEIDEIQSEDISGVYDDTNSYDLYCMNWCNITTKETTTERPTTTTPKPTTTTPRHRSIDLSGKSVVLQLVIVVNDTFNSDMEITNSTVYTELVKQYKSSLTTFYSNLLPQKFKKIVILGFSRGSILCNYSLETTAPTNESEANSTVKELRDVKWKKDSLMNLTIDVNKTIEVQKVLLENDKCVLPINVCAHHEVLDWDKNGNPECKYKCDIPENKVYCGAHGECSFTYEGSIRCICKDGYSGNLCETPKPTTTTAKPIKPDAIALSKIDIIGIAGGIGGGLVLILLVALCCVYSKLNKAKKRDRFYGYMDNDKEFLHDENSRIENVPDLKNEYTNLGYQTEQDELQMQRFEPEGKNVDYEPGQRQGAYERDDKSYRKVEEPEGGNVLIYQPKHLNGPMERQSGASKFDEVEERSTPYRMMDTDTTYKIRRPTVNSDRNVPYN